MRIFFTLSAILATVVTGFAQPKKMFINSKGRISSDSVRAAAYIMEEKVADSTYLIIKYDLKHQPLIKGTYKDSLMTIRSGKFYFYGRFKTENLETKETTDGLVYLSSAGYYLNGARTGPWLVYDFSGIKMEQFTFENDMLNGPFTRFNINNGNIEEEGNFVNGKRQGDFNTYLGNEKKPDITYRYENNHVVKTISHNRLPVAADNLDRYLARTLDNYIDTLKAMQIVVDLAISDKGKVDSVFNFNQPLPAYISEAVKTAFSNAPVFIPGIQNDLPVSHQYIYNFKYGVTLPSGRSLISGYSSHADLIGRGLNQLGIGKTVN